MTDLNLGQMPEQNAAGRLLDRLRLWQLKATKICPSCRSALQGDCPETFVQFLWEQASGSFRDKSTSRNHLRTRQTSTKVLV